jgi:signal transduction histidine kinase/CheY-like chemotaxis protein
LLSVSTHRIRAHWTPATAVIRAVLAVLATALVMICSSPRTVSASPPASSTADWHERLSENSRLLDEDLPEAAARSRALADAAKDAGQSTVAAAALMQLSCAEMGLSGARKSHQNFETAVKMMSLSAPPLERLLLSQAMFRRSRYFGKLGRFNSFAAFRIELTDQTIQDRTRLVCFCDIFGDPDVSQKLNEGHRESARNLAAIEPDVSLRNRLRFCELQKPELWIPSKFLSPQSEVLTWVGRPDFPKWPRRFRIQVYRFLAATKKATTETRQAIDWLQQACNEARQLGDQTLLVRCLIDRYDAEQKAESEGSGLFSDAVELESMVAAICDPELLLAFMYRMSVEDNRRQSAIKTQGVRQINWAQLQARIEAENAAEYQSNAAQTTLSRQAEAISIAKATADSLGRSFAVLLCTGLVVFMVLALVLAKERLMLRRTNSQLCEQIVVNRKHQTEKDRIEQRMAQRDRLDSLGTLAGGIAHDFNNLLVGVMGNADLIRNSESLPSEVTKRCLDGIMTSAQAAAELSRKMLAYAGKSPAEKKVVNLNELIVRLMPLLESGLRGQQQIQLESLRSPLLTIADGGQLEQVLLNLVTNGIQAMNDSQKCLSIRTGRIELTQIPIDVPTFGSRKEGGQFVWFEVEDSGSGIADDDMARIFEPFFTTKQDSAEHGFGLAVVYGHVNRHDGLIQVESQQGRGTRFRILLPEAPLMTAVGNTSRRDFDLSLRGAFRRVLVVDDQPQVLDVIRGAFESLGCQVETFSDATSALECLVDDRSFDCMYLDIMMPKFSGAEVLAEMEHRNLNLPIIVMSGFSDVNLQEFLVYPFVKATLAKPFRAEDLLAAARQALASSAPMDSDEPAYSERTADVVEESTTA